MSTTFMYIFTHDNCHEPVTALHSLLGSQAVIAYI